MRATNTAQCEAFREALIKHMQALEVARDMILLECEDMRYTSMGKDASLIAHIINAHVEILPIWRKINDLMKHHVSPACPETYI